MTLSQAQLDRVAAQAGFRAEPLEKVLQLLELLEGLRSHPFLTDRLVLKGGTALNLFVLDMPRLSVDIEWSDRLVRECRELLSDLLPFTPPEQEFLELLNGAGEVEPHLLTEDVQLQDRVRTHPALLWKALNVRRHRRASQNDAAGGCLAGR